MKALEIDGKTLEGGGQLVRIVLGLAALTRTAVHITDIRGNRRGSSSSSPGGLKRQHLTAAKWLADACNAQTEGLALASPWLLFQPLAKHPTPDASKARFTTLKDGRQAREVVVSLESQGAVSLLLQALLPYLIFSGMSRDHDEAPTPLHLTLVGGTHVSSSPSLCYITSVLIPNLSVLYPDVAPLIAPSPLGQTRHGWNFGSSQLGRASFIVNPLPTGQTLPPFNVPPRGDIRAIHLTVLAPDVALSTLKFAALEAIKASFPQVPEVVITRAEESGQRQRYYVLMAAEAANGCRLGSDALYSGQVAQRGINPISISNSIVERCVGSLARELATGCSLDHRMSDQIAVFMGLARGVSRFQDEPREGTPAADRRPSLHALTARWAVEKMLGARFEDDGTAHGVGFAAGTQTWSRPADDDDDDDDDGSSCAAVEKLLEDLHV